MVKIIKKQNKKCKTQSSLNDSNKISQERMNDDKNSEIKKRAKKTSKIKFRKKLIIFKRKAPSIFHFNINSNFIYDPSQKDTYTKMENNLNIVKPKKSDIAFLNEKIEELGNLLSDIKNEKYISLPKNILDTINNFKTKSNERSDIEEFLLEQFKNNTDRSHLTCRNLAELYSIKSGKVIHKSQVNNIIKKKLGLRYLKTSVKTNKILRKENILFSFCFIKIIIRAIKLGYEILFQDESSILCSNNNYKCWRYLDEKIYFGEGIKKRKNLILLVGKDSIIYHKINDETTNEDSFLKFMEEALKAIKKKEIKNYLIVMDNLSVHKTSKLMDFYRENKVNILFNSPYCSFFNAIELCFRAIKRILYKKLFKDINEVEKEVNNIIDKKEFGDTLLANYRETINQYIEFYEKNKFISLKNLIL